MGPCIIFPIELEFGSVSFSVSDCLPAVKTQQTFKPLAGCTGRFNCIMCHQGDSFTMVKFAMIPILNNSFQHDSMTWKGQGHKYVP